MHTFSALVVAAAAACAIARPSGPTASAEVSRLVSPREHSHPSLATARKYLNDYIWPPLMMPQFIGYEESPRILLPHDTEHDWLNKEIERINEMEEEEESPNPYETEHSRWTPRYPYGVHSFEDPARMRDVSHYLPEMRRSESYNARPSPPFRNQIPLPQKSIQIQLPRKSAAQLVEKKKSFALTPLDKGYYIPEEKFKTQPSGGAHEGGESKSIVFEPPRQIRQNPNLSRTKTLVTDDLERLKTRVPHEDAESKKKSHGENMSVVEAVDPADSIYGVALVAAVGSALAMVIVGFAFGWYKLSKKAKAAADVDYPAYGVTGPTIDTSGDRKLAHSAHMYHYQHQKQQIIAMERNGMEPRTGSVSDPESEEENEEGDYTVYECPGFATTGEMEVKNPLFSEDPTPATPGKCELVKPQPRD